MTDEHDPGDEDPTAESERFWFPVTRPPMSVQHRIPPTHQHYRPITTGAPT